MLTLEEIKQLTEPVFDSASELVVPEPSLDWKRKIESLEELHLTRQRETMIYDMRCEQAEKMGFKKVLVEDMIKLMMGDEEFVELDNDDLKRQNHEWLFNHHTGETIEGKSCKWGNKPNQWAHFERKGLWHKPPFAKYEKWRVQWGKLPYLRRDIPYGVMLKMIELKKLDLFNVFNVLAPIEAWERKDDIDPIIMAGIWEMPIGKDEDYHTDGLASYFFVAQW